MTPRITLAVALLTLTIASLPVHDHLLAQSVAAVSPMHVHHVHLNSVDPKAAAEYYPKAFPASASVTTFNGLDAVKSGNVHLLFSKVAVAPRNELTGPQTSVWHFGWNTPDSRKYNERFRAMGLEIAQMWDAADGKLADLSSARFRRRIEEPELQAERQPGQSEHPPELPAADARDARHASLC